MPRHPVDRRDFIRQLAATGAAACAGLGGSLMPGRAQEQPAAPTPPPPPMPVSPPPPPPGARYVAAPVETGEAPCLLCPRGCKIKKTARGECQAYVYPAEGPVQSLSYGKVAKFRIEPIETDHFFHVLPGTAAALAGTPTCNLHCSYCSEWRISQFPVERVPNEAVEPKALVDRAAAAGVKLLGLTYSDPAVAIEYAIDVATLAREAGLYPIAHTGAYLMPGPMKDLASALVALNVDLKAYADTTYKSLCQGSLQPVLDALKAVRETPAWLEITYLVVPGYNDALSQIKDMCKWIVENCGPLTPVHFVRFFPQYQHRQWQTPPTNPLTLKSFREAGYEAGLAFVYVGNMPGDTGESTLCPKCHELLIRRIGANVSAVEFDPVRGLCGKCGAAIPGIWQ